MQIHLRGLTRSEWQSLMNVVNYVLKSLREPQDFEEFQLWDGLRDLLMDMMRRIPEMKGKMNLTLKESAATALFVYVDTSQLPPYEQSLMMQIMGQVDLQWRSRMTMLKGNMMADQALLGGGDR